MRARLLLGLAAALLAPHGARGAETLVLDRPMAPPAWALLERELLLQQSRACESFAAKYLDARGYLLHTPRWGALDGPDDAIETFWNWPLLHALGGRDAVLAAFKKAYDGHLRQYAALRTTTTDLAKDGAYQKEFVTQIDWFHTGEGLRGFFFQGLSDPGDARYRERMRRYAGLYMNEDAGAPNYDPKARVIRSLFNGSRGPLLRKTTPADWAGDPIDGRFHMLHAPAGREGMLDVRRHYPKMLAHFTDYVDAEGDNFLNLAATILPTLAYMLTSDEKYRAWVTDYVGAWRERTAASGGNIPSVVGPDGVPGSNHGGRWWKGTYGWNFSIFDGEIERTAHRNYLTAGTWPGFSNALLVTGDLAWIDVLRRQLDNIFAQQKVEGGRVLVPKMYGDPRGYKFDGPPQWYEYTDDLLTDRQTEIYLWSMERRDLERVPKTGWIAFLEGNAPEFPAAVLSGELDRLRRQAAAIRADTTTAETRLADYLLDLNPASVDALTTLMLGGYFARGRIRMLHSRFRFFDPVAKRAGLPEDVASLVEGLGAQDATLSLVNLNQAEPRTLVVQAGGYGEHHFESVALADRTTPVDSRFLTVRLEPGCGARLRFQMKRYSHAPSLALPWGPAAPRDRR
jgi:hypothetical protein